MSFGKSKSEAKATADGNASVVIETSAGGATSSARATINITSGHATAKIKSSSGGSSVQTSGGVDWSFQQELDHQADRVLIVAEPTELSRLSAQGITIKATLAQTHFKRNNSWSVG